MNISGFRPSQNVQHLQPSGSERLMRHHLIQKLHDPALTPDERYSILVHLRMTESFDPNLPNPRQSGIGQTDMPQPASEWTGTLPRLRSLRDETPFAPQTNPVHAQFADEVSDLLRGGAPRPVVNFGMPGLFGGAP
jgi:hypothetical protein